MEKIHVDGGGKIELAVQIFLQAGAGDARAFDLGTDAGRAFDPDLYDPAAKLSRSGASGMASALESGLIYV